MVYICPSARDTDENPHLPSVPATTFCHTMMIKPNRQKLLLVPFLFAWFFLLVINNVRNLTITVTKSKFQTPQESVKYYSPSHLEKEIMQKAASEFHFDQKKADDCFFYQSDSRLSQEYNEYKVMLQSYTDEVNKADFRKTDIRYLTEEAKEGACVAFDAILNNHFRNKTRLSRTYGVYIEPLLPPLRHPRLCEVKKRRNRWLLNIDYLVHDFGEICRNLETASRTVFIDLGASLEFHNKSYHNPTVSLMGLYERFGIKFDHYYAFEQTNIPPDRAFQSIPENLIPAYHWFNVPVEAHSKSRQNPWNSILVQYSSNDFVVIKLDIDTPEIEIALVHQLLQEEFSGLVDQLYFEYHVNTEKMNEYWGGKVEDTLYDSLALFTSLRQKGISAHSWV